MLAPQKKKQHLTLEGEDPLTSLPFYQNSFGDFALPKKSGIGSWEVTRFPYLYIASQLSKCQIAVSFALGCLMPSFLVGVVLI